MISKEKKKKNINLAFKIEYKRISLLVITTNQSNKS